MSKIQIKKTLQRAHDNFLASNYEGAIRDFALVLELDADNKEAFYCAILADMANSDDGAGNSLYEYYMMLRDEDAESANIIISEIIETMDGTVDQLSNVIVDGLKQKLSYENGIMYNDFKALIDSNKDFNTIFENIMFSTKVIITEKEDFVDFLDNLIVHGYKEMAFSYLESALGVYPNDKDLRNLLRRLAKGKNIENSTTKSAI